MSLINAKLESSNDTKKSELKEKTYFSFSVGFTLAIIANVLWGTTFLASKYTVNPSLTSYKIP